MGSGWQALVAYVNIGSYYIIGVPLGVLLGWIMNLGIWVPFIHFGVIVLIFFFPFITLIKHNGQAEFVSTNAGFMGWNDRWNGSADMYTSFEDCEM